MLSVHTHNLFCFHVWIIPKVGLGYLLGLENLGILTLGDNKWKTKDHVYEILTEKDIPINIRVNLKNNDTSYYLAQ
ncbi:hypothetical protein L1987_14266 [Smallanthus sonchifolius]|uniref:Uncharacterized protein n=1 Tax=Smallanthus sonchifolius TaxID=185202 RepID=A0ACB9J3C7_9ASTR|nr:hypothetical protein L1987_14266 [Smallanthus sonchifolius]